MAVSKSSLSAGEIIRAMLIEDSEVMARANKVFPVVEDNAELPYIVYRRTQLEQDPTKRGRGADTVGIEILCYTAGYTEGESDGLFMRSCYLADSEEAWQDDAYIQQLVFNVKI